MLRGGKGEGGVSQWGNMLWLMGAGGSRGQCLLSAKCLNVDAGTKGHQLGVLPELQGAQDSTATKATGR